MLWYLRINLWIPLTFELYQLAIKVFCSCLYSLEFFSSNRCNTSFSHSDSVKSLLSTYRDFFKRFLASLCEGNRKDCKFCFLVSVRWFSFIFYNVYLYVAISVWCCCLFICSYICLVLKGTNLMKVLLFLSYIIEKKKEKSQKT